MQVRIPRGARAARAPRARAGRVAERIPGGTVGVGLALALATAAISGVSIFVNAYAVREFHDPTVFTTLKNVLVGAALLALVARAHPVAEVRRLGAGRRAGLLLLAIVGGSIPFVLFFNGLAHATSGNASFIQKTQFAWVAVLALVFLRERVGRLQLGALGMLLLAQVLLSTLGGARPGAGEAMVLGATLFWSVEVIVAKRVLGEASALLGATARMALGAAILLGWLGVSGQLGALAGLSGAQWAWGVATSALLLGYVTTWYAALKRAPATAVTCVLTVGAPITAALSAAAGRGAPDAAQLAAYGLILAGAATFAAVAALATRRRPAARIEVPA